MARGAYAGRGKKKRNYYRRHAVQASEEGDDAVEDQLSEDQIDIDDDRDPDDFEDMVNTRSKDLSPPVQAAKTALMVSIYASERRSYTNTITSALLATHSVTYVVSRHATPGQ